MQNPKALHRIKNTLRPIVTLLLILITMTLRANDTTKTNCQKHQQNQQQFTRAYDQGNRQKAFQLATQLHQTQHHCPTKPNKAPFYEVLYRWTQGDSTYNTLLEQNLRNAQKAKDSAKIIRALSHKGATQAMEGKYPQAITHFTTCAGWYHRNHHYARYIITTYNRLTTLQQMDRYTETIEVALQGLQALKTIPDSTPRRKWAEGIFHQKAGFALTTANRHREALQQAQKSIPIFRTLRDSMQQALSYNLIGGIYQSLKQPDSAMQYLDSCIALADTSTIQGKLTLGRANYTLAMVWEKKGDLEKALRLAKQSARIARQYDNENSYQRSRLVLGNMMVRAKIPGAAAILKEAYTYFQKNKSQEYLKATAESMALAYMQEGKEDQAIKSLQAAFGHGDTLFSDNMAAAMKDAEVKYETKRKEDQLADSEKALQQTKTLAETQRQLLIAVIAGLFIALILGALALRSSRKTRKANTQLEAQKQELQTQYETKDLLLKEIHHRVKNNLQVVSSLLELQTRDIEDEKARQLAREGQSRVRSMALIHQRLYQNDDLLINFDEFTKQLVTELKSMYSPDKTVNTAVAAEGYTFDIDTAIPLGLIMNELITNAFKYGLSQTTEKELIISLQKEDDQLYKLEVTDNGQGLKPEVDIRKTRSLGLRLVRRLARQLHGKMEQSNASGCTFTVWFRDTAGRMQMD